MKTVCENCFSLVNLWMLCNRHIGIYDIDKSTETETELSRQCKFEQNACLNLSGFEIEMIFQYCDATFIDIY